MKRFWYVFLFIPAILFVFNTSCIEDKCTATRCLNEGVCVGGICACPYGYEGEMCSTEWYQKFIGSWNVQESLKAGVVVNEYSLNAVHYSSVDSIALIGLDKAEDSVLCVRKLYRTFTILNKMLQNGDSVMSGEAVIGEDGIVTGGYSLWKDGAQQNIRFTWTR